MDEVRPEFLKALDLLGLSWLACLCNVAWISGALSLDWQGTRVRKMAINEMKRN